MLRAASYPPRRKLIAESLNQQNMSWVLSFVVHCVGLLLLAGLFRIGTGGTGRDIRRDPLPSQFTVAVAEEMFDEEAGEVIPFSAPGDSPIESPEETTPTTTTSQKPNKSLRELTGDFAPRSPQGILPDRNAAIDDNAGSSGISNPGKFGNKRPENLAHIGGKARTQVYGLEGEGSKFVYVFDRSASMGGVGFTPLQSAKAELLASLESFDENHQFQIIFYNQQPTVMQLSNREGGLVWGTEQSRIQARRFSSSIAADGGTDHLPALEIALKLAPDVIFFLTDGDQPELSDNDLRRVHRLNGSEASINVIEFGRETSGGKRENFLTRLAAQNNGQYIYVDVTKLRPKR